MPTSDRRTIAHILKNTVNYESVMFWQSTKNIVTRNMSIERLNGKGLIDVFEDFGVSQGFYGAPHFPDGFTY